MKNVVYLNEQEYSFALTKDSITEIFGEEKDNTFCENLNASLSEIILKKENEFYKSHKQIIDNSIEKLLYRIKEVTRPYREHINKYFLSDNLNFFLSNGCSVYAGSKTINSGSDDYAVILNKIKPRDFPKEIKGKINDIKNLRPEQLLDQLLQLQLYFESVGKKQRQVSRIKGLINEVKKHFLLSCIVPIDYSKNHHHKTFLKKIVSRPSSLNKVNIFTINYDLLIEKTAEEIEIVVNNGFVGFHKRTFQPSSFKLNLFLKETAASKPYSRLINLYKLHGSITWKYENEIGNNPYGIEEVQIASNSVSIDEISNCIIYPIQYKKKHALDLPYSELLRQFIENLHKPNSALLVMGYSFLDEHINDLVLNALLNPDFHLIVFSYQNPDEISEEQKFLKELIARSKHDSRITIFSGPLLGSFEGIITYLIPYAEEKDYQQVILETVKEIRDGLRKK